LQALSVLRLRADRPVGFFVLDKVQFLKWKPTCQQGQTKIVAVLETIGYKSETPARTGAANAGLVK